MITTEIKESYKLKPRFKHSKQIQSTNTKESESDTMKKSKKTEVTEEMRDNMKKR